jgi:hypothetical protein
MPICVNILPLAIFHSRSPVAAGGARESLGESPETGGRERYRNDVAGVGSCGLGDLDRQTLRGVRADVREGELRQQSERRSGSSKQVSYSTTRPDGETHQRGPGDLESHPAGALDGCDHLGEQDDIDHKRRARTRMQIVIVLTFSPPERQGFPTAVGILRFAVYHLFLRLESAGQVLKVDSGLCQPAGTPIIVQTGR